MAGLVLDTLQVSGRLGRLRRIPDQPSALLLTSLTNIRYLTGFTGSAGMLFVHPEGAVLLTDGRYQQQAAEQVEAAAAAVTVVVAPAPAQKEQAARLVAEWAPDALGLEAGNISWARQRALATEWFPGIEMVPTEGLVESLRRVKDDAEISRLTAAAQLADTALAAVRPLLADGPTEAEFGRRLDFTMRELGAAGPSFETIVASGPNASMPHHRPSERRIGRHETVVLDFGALYDGYCSDMTRTVWVDDLLHPELKRAVDVVFEAQAAGVAAVRAGVDAAAVDAACREVIAGAGWGDRFLHGTGHGVGLDIHEAPSVSAASPDRLEAGHVVTVEPGVYLPGLGGVRIEDTVLVTADGCRCLTATPKDRP
jgi:Xaa-Pro aminopeptidase